MSYPVIIAAMARNGVMGDSNSNSLPWPRQADDMAWFRQKTLHQNVVMGHKTFMSLRGLPLENRYNTVISSVTSRPSGNLQYVRDMNDLRNWMRWEGDGPFYVIGGRSIYEQMLPQVNEMFITTFNFDAEGDLTFPEINPSEWALTAVQTLENGVVTHYTRIVPVNQDEWRDTSDDDNYDDDDYEDDDDDMEWED